MAMECSSLENGEEFVYKSVNFSMSALISAFRMMVVDNIGVHLRSLVVGKKKKKQHKKQHKKKGKQHGHVASSHKYLTSKCFNILEEEREQIIRVTGYSIKQQDGDGVLTPDLIISSFPIDWNQPSFASAQSCADVCDKATNQQCICVPFDHQSNGGRDLVYLVWSQQISGAVYFNTLKGVVGFTKFNMFDKLVIPDVQPIKNTVSVQLNPFVPGGHSSSHILLHDHDYQVNKPTINIMVSRKAVKSTMSNPPFPLIASVHSLEIPKAVSHQKKMKRQITTSCIIDPTNAKCHFQVPGEYDHHISIESALQGMQNVTLQFTKMKAKHLRDHKSTLIFDAHQYHKHHDHHVFYIVGIIVGILLFLVISAICYLEKYSPRSRSHNSSSNDQSDYQQFAVEEEDQRNESQVNVDI